MISLRRRAEAFGALSVVPFRWLLVGQLTSSTGWQIGNLAQGWLVYALTGSALSLGWVDSGGSVATIVFSLLGGIVADHLDKRRLMVLGQAGLGIMPLVIAILMGLFGRVPIWVLGLNSLTIGLFFSFIMPARESYTTELVGRRALLNAMALRTTSMALVGILSASLGGLLVERMGAQAAFLIVAGVYTTTVLVSLRLPRPTQTGAANLSVGVELVAGIRYVMGQPLLLTILGMELIRVLFLIPHQTFLPVFAADVFRKGAVGLGVMSAVSSLGGLLGALLVASLGDYQHKGQLLLLCGGASSLALLFFARVSSFLPALALLMILSMASNAYMVTRSALLQASTAPEMRGRIVGFWRLVWGMAPLGTLPAGALADRWGAPLLVSLQAAVSLIAFVGVLVVVPTLRRVE